MKPESLSEQLMFNTVRLETADGASSGTGFFFNFKIDDLVYPTIVTNKHVVRYNPNEIMRFHLHLKDIDGGTTENYQVTIQAKWIFHSSQDLCFCFVNPLFEKVKVETGKTVFYVWNDESILATEDKLKDLSALEEIVMVGYPIGLWDSHNNYPIFRKGFTASHPAVDFNGGPTGIIDAACFPGSSGSPIYILNESNYKDKHGNIYFGNSRIIFLGVLHSGPQWSADGELVVEQIPTANGIKIKPNVKVMVNLGYYVKARELLEFKKYIQDNYSAKH